MFLESAKAVRIGLIAASCEESLGQFRADPCAREGLVRGELPIKSAGPSRDAPANFIWAENRPCCSQIGQGSSISCEADLICMADGAWVVIRFATQEEHDAVLHIDAGVIVDSLSGIDNAVTDEDDLTLEIGRGGVKDREVVSTQLRCDQLVRCAGAKDRVGFDE